MSDEKALCEICGEPMPPGEQMFKFHGYSGDCPKPPLPRPEWTADQMEAARKIMTLLGVAPASPSREPGACEMSDKVARIIAAIPR